MKYLTPDIAILAKKANQKSLVRSSTSCGIFQDVDYNAKTPELYHQKKIKEIKR